MQQEIGCVEEQKLNKGRGANARKFDESMRAARTVKTKPLKALPPAMIKA